MVKCLTKKKERKAVVQKKKANRTTADAKKIKALSFTNSENLDENKKIKIYYGTKTFLQFTITLRQTLVLDRYVGPLPSSPPTCCLKHFSFIINNISTKQTSITLRSCHHTR